MQTYCVHQSITYIDRNFKEIFADWARRARLRFGYWTFARLLVWLRVHLNHRQQASSLPPRIQRLAWRLHQYTFRIQHIAGNANTADSLSRLPSEQNDFSDTGLVCKDYIRFVFTSNMWDPQAVTLSDMRSKTSRSLNYLFKHRRPKLQLWDDHLAQ